MMFNSKIPFWDKEGYLIKGYHHIQIKTIPEIFLEKPIQGKIEDYQGHLCKSLKQSLGKYHECKWCYLLEEKDKVPEDSFWGTEGETSGGTGSITEKTSTESKAKEDGSD
ncbi:Hypothetical predicted protein [Olea europaea subsp. europaea]|uniref:Uncharacterized protein n=1 Tax=Olea europaea subsp. europaea TaxID=158383 RepID=A0A8S0RXY5_OLEEU|nr:Hypothetical predicted protein [Olea europaea subsp. europaea]